MRMILVKNPIFSGLFNIASLNILWTMVSSTRFGYDSIKVAQLTTILERMTRDIHPKEMGFLVFPWLRFVPKATAYGRFMQDGKEIQAYFRASSVLMKINDSEPCIYKNNNIPLFHCRP